MYFIYIIYSENRGVKYIGHTNDIERRLWEHNQNVGCRYTKNKGPWKLIHQENFETRANAIAREKILKTGVGRDWIKKQFGI